MKFTSGREIEFKGPYAGYRGYMVSKIKNRNGQTLDFSYDTATTRLTSITATPGGTTTLTYLPYNGVLYVDKITAPDNTFAQFGYTIVVAGAPSSTLKAT